MTDTMPQMPVMSSGGTAPPAGSAQMQALMTAAMAAMMTPEHQKVMLAMESARVQAQDGTTFRLPTDSTGKTFTKEAPCVVQQPKNVTIAPIPPALVDLNVTVVSTRGERVLVKYPSGEQREFHKTELGLK